MLSAYPACIFQEEQGCSVIFPDLNFLSTCGESMDEALSMAVDCLAGYLYSCKMYKEEIPVPSAIGEINLKKVAEELEQDLDRGFVNMITVDVEEYAKVHFEKSVKKTLTIPEWLNNAALEKNINFSHVLQDALKARLHME